MHRFYLPPELCVPPTLFLGGREAHHALHVLRLRRGERVTVLDGAGNQYSSEVEAYDQDKLKLRVLEKKSIPRPACQITLVQALPKGKLIESIIQKATELGVTRVVPVWSERTVLRLKPAEAIRKQLKWQAVAVEAIKQCGAAWLPKIEPPVGLEEFLKLRQQFELSLVGSLGEGAQHPRACFGQFQKNHGRVPASLGFFIGPEGDFTPQEMEALVASGALPITLGPLVLRTETAAIYCLAVAQYELQWAASRGLCSQS